MDPSDPNFRWRLGQLRIRLAPLIINDAMVVKVLTDLMGVGHPVVVASEATMWLTELESLGVVVRVRDGLVISEAALTRYLANHGIR